MAKTDNSVSMTELKNSAKKLKDCIDDATRDIESTNNMKVSEVAANCIVLLGY